MQGFSHASLCCMLMLSCRAPAPCSLCGPCTTRRRPVLGPTRAIRVGLLRAKQAEAECLRAVLAQCEARNVELAGALADRRREAQELAAKAQVGLNGQRCSTGALALKRRNHGCRRCDSSTWWQLCMSLLTRCAAFGPRGAAFAGQRLQ